MTDLAVPDTSRAPETLSPSRGPQVNETENAVSRFCAIRNHQTCTNCPCISELCLISKAKGLLIPDSQFSPDLIFNIFPLPFTLIF